MADFEVPNADKGLGRSRYTMPQIKIEDFLKDIGEGAYTIKSLKPSTLIPSQKHFNMDKVAARVASDAPIKGIISSSDNYVIDGHHAWLASHAKGINVTSTVVNKPAKELLAFVKDKPYVTTKKLNEGFLGGLGQAAMGTVAVLSHAANKAAPILKKAVSVGFESEGEVSARQSAEREERAAARRRAGLPPLVESTPKTLEQFLVSVQESKSEMKRSRHIEFMMMNEELKPTEDAIHSIPNPEHRGHDLIGNPTHVAVDGKVVKFGGFKPAQDVAASYMKSAGMEYNPPKVYTKADPERGARIAQAFDDMKHDPHHPEVKAAYRALVDETKAQYEHMIKHGVTVDFHKDGNDTYGNPRNAIMDVTHNNHLSIFPTDAGFGGSESSHVDISDNPLLEPTGHMISGKPAVANDLFRAVHDYFGHVQHGLGFRAAGEDNAWRQHAAMYSPAARSALTTETRGQNSWVNFGPHKDFNKTANGGDTQYAPQKVGILPKWVEDEGRHDELHEAVSEKKAVKKDTKKPAKKVVPDKKETTDVNVEPTIDDTYTYRQKSAEANTTKGA